MRVRVWLVSCALESVEGRVWTSLSNVSRAPWDPRRPSASAASSPRHVRTAKARVDAMLAGCEAVDLIRHRRASSTNFTEAPKLLKYESGAATVIRNRCICQLWVVFSDAEGTFGTGMDTRSSCFPKSCRFGAGQSDITKCSTFGGPSTHSVCGKCVCAYPLVCGE